jgi:hypothetical protein
VVADIALVSSLTDLLSIADYPTDGCEVVHGVPSLSPDKQEVLAHILADDAMSVRCGASPVLATWRKHRDSGLAYTDQQRRQVEVFANLGFGLRSKPRSDTHLRGHVAELIWRRLIEERDPCLDGRRKEYLHQLKGEPTEPGADGFVVYRTRADTLVFRLWEVKKFEGSDDVISTVQKACRQLRDEGARYLALLAGPGSLQPGDLGRFLGE